MKVRVRFTDVFIKRDGRWQVWATQGTVIPLGTPTKPRSKRARLPTRFIVARSFS